MTANCTYLFITCITLGVAFIISLLCIFHLMRRYDLRVEAFNEEENQTKELLEYKDNEIVKLSNTITELEAKIHNSKKKKAKKKQAPEQMNADDELFNPVLNASHLKKLDISKYK